jgi:hypothetical protein
LALVHAHSILLCVHVQVMYINEIHAMVSVTCLLLFFFFFCITNFRALKAWRRIAYYRYLIIPFEFSKKKFPFVQVEDFGLAFLEVTYMSLKLGSSNSVTVVSV